MVGAGFPVAAADILTAPAIAAYLNEHYPSARCLLLNSGQIGEDLAGVTLALADDPATGARTARQRSVLRRRRARQRRARRRAERVLRHTTGNSGPVSYAAPAFWLERCGRT